MPNFYGPKLINGWYCSDSCIVTVHTTDALIIIIIILKYPGSKCSGVKNKQKD